MSDSTVRALTIGKQYVERRWIQGNAVDEYGGVCAQQAIMQGAGGNSEVFYRCEKAMILAIAELRQGMFYNVPNWNDHVSRTLDQVLAAFDRAIENETPQMVEVKIPPSLAAADFIEELPEPVEPEPVKVSVIEKIKVLVGV